MGTVKQEGGKGGYTRAGGRLVPKKPARPTSTRFIGECEELDGKTFECSNSRAAEKFEEILKAIIGHVGKKYSHGCDAPLCLQYLTL